VKRRERTILKKLYTLADPIIRRLPGRDIEEKRVVFNTIALSAILLIYVSPLPRLVMQYVYTVPGLIGAVLLFILLPVLVVSYLLDVYDEYREKIEKMKKKDQQQQS